MDPNGKRRAQENTVYINANNVKVEIARREQKSSFIRKLCNNRELLNKLSNERMEQDEKTRKDKKRTVLVTSPDSCKQQAKQRSVNRDFR